MVVLRLGFFGGRDCESPLCRGALFTVEDDWVLVLIVNQ
jgi:hypothetical protein